MRQLFLKVNLILLILAIIYALLKYLKIIKPEIVNKIDNKVSTLIKKIFSIIKNFFKKIFNKIKSLIKKEPKELKPAKQK